MNLFDHVRFLHESELFHDLKQLSCIVISLCDNNPNTEVLSLSQRYQCMVYYGNSLYHLGEFLRAENIYKKALLLKKALNKSKGKITATTPVQPSQDVTSEVDVKYKLYQCLSQMKQFREAMSILEGISSKQRTAKVNVALAKLYVMAGMDRSAITSYKEVIRECPFSLESIQGLLSLGVKGADVAALVMNGLPHGASCDWLSSWIKGQAYLATREYGNAIITFKQMDQKMCLKDNVYIVNSIAEARFYEGNDTAALTGFQRSHQLDPLFLKNMDLFSYLLAKEKKTMELQRLSEQLMKVTDKAPEPWISFGYYSLISRKVARTRTVYFAQKASIIDPFNVEAYLLKGTALFELKKSQDASLHFQEALRHAPHRYEAYHGLISCYLSLHRTREALACAGKAIKTIGSNPRTLTIYASVLTNEPNMSAKAKPYLEKAMKLDPSYLEPVYVMAEILLRDHQYDKGTEMLRKQLHTHNTCRLHQQLGDFLAQISEPLEALDEYNIALSLDPTNTRAREGKERVEKHNDVGLESTYDLEDMEGSDNDGDFDGSDVESNWSETEFS
ncbi:anaphase-promoting complex subunit 7 [Mytilus galloprovincialis]|uniref:Anaphase-promoting complex subunit 7 n=1 Tax=Mytilus galloprovincialis TaxID=29158 RepID=A0A8B6GFB9_MYTGA|nr:anaphase-promoting complex subunit 7 [Mytilus galloprovincialis]